MISSITRNGVRRTLQNAYADYRFMLHKWKIDDDLYTPVGFVTTVLIGMYVLWLACQWLLHNTDALYCIFLFGACYLGRGLFTRGIR